MTELIDKETKAREAQALLNNQVLTAALAAIEAGALEDLYRGNNDGEARARITVVREFKTLLTMAIVDARQAASRPRLA